MQHKRVNFSLGLQPMFEFLASRLASIEPEQMSPRADQHLPALIYGDIHTVVAPGYHIHGLPRIS